MVTFLSPGRGALTKFNKRASSKYIVPNLEIILFCFVFSIGIQNWLLAALWQKEEN